MASTFCSRRKFCIQNQLVSHVTKDISSCTICSKAELLTIGGCANLKSIDAQDMLNLKMFEVTGGCPELMSVDLEGAVNLQGLSWEGFQGQFPNLTSLESLKGLWLVGPEKTVLNPPFKGCLDFPSDITCPSHFDQP